MAAITTAVIAGVAAVGSAYSQRKAGKAQARASRAEARRAEIANARERRATVRNARVARAQVEAMGATAGLSGGSTVAGSMASIGQQLGSNLNWLDVNAELTATASAANMQAAKYMSQANTWAAVGEIAQGVGGQWGGSKPMPDAGLAPTVPAVVKKKGNTNPYKG